MKMKIYALRDQKISAFLAPLTMQALGQVMRFLSDEVNKKDGNMLAAHPEDFELFELGDYETDTGQISPSTPKSLTLLTELVVSNK